MNQPCTLRVRTSWRPYATGFPQIPRHLRATGLPCGVRMPKLAKLAISGGRAGWAFVVISSSQALIHGT